MNWKKMGKLWEGLLQLEDDVKPPTRMRIDLCQSHERFVGSSQVASKTNTLKPKYSGRTQLPKKKRERPCPPLLYGAHNSESKSKCRIPNCIAVAGSNLVSGYGNHEPVPSHPWETPQHARASMTLSSRNSVGSLPNISSSPCYATLKHSPSPTATSSQTDHPMEEADDSTGIQQKLPTEGSVQVSCPFPKSYEKFWYNSRRRQSVPSCALNDVGLPLRPGEKRCTSYNLWGLCKFGPSCKYDHSPI